MIGKVVLGRRPGRQDQGGTEDKSAKESLGDAGVCFNPHLNYHLSFHSRIASSSLDHPETNASKNPPLPGDHQPLALLLSLSSLQFPIEKS